MSRRPSPTVRQYAEICLVGLRSQRTVELYRHYLRRVVDLYGDTPVSQIVASDITRVAEYARDAAASRRTGVDGASAAEHTIAACRRLLNVAELDGVITSNPALKVPKPRRSESPRHALTRAQMGQIFAAADDRHTPILRLMLETGVRRESVIGLDIEQVNPSRQTLSVVEKGRKRRELPISALMLELLRDIDGPLYGWTPRRLERMWGTIHKRVPWSGELGVSSHWIRHTTITWIEQTPGGGYIAAAAIAGHSLRGQGATPTYVRMTVEDLALVWSRCFGEHHPLAVKATRAS